MITVRAALPDDADAIADAHVTAWRVGYRGVFPDEYLDSDEFESDRRDWWEQRLIDGPPDNDNVLNELVVAELDGRVVGFGHVGDELVDDGPRSGRGEVYGFYLHPDAWGSGAATEMMRTCEAALAGHFDTAVLWTLFATPRSRRFYEKAGWTCGAGDAVLTSSWHVPPGTPAVPIEPVTIVQYRRSLR